MFKNDEIIDDVNIVVGTVIGIKCFPLGFLGIFKGNIKVYTSFQDFQDDFEKGMYVDELVNWFDENTSDFSVCFDDINDNFIFYIDLNNVDEDTTIKEIKNGLVDNMLKFNLHINYVNVDIFALED